MNPTPDQEVTTEKSNHALREEKVLAYWKEHGIFEKSLAKDSPKGEFVFYDGPPFATGTPHYGHILAGTMKDAIPRYKTMQGFHVPRRWGWDCHGLPLENLIEKELGLATKRDIEALGIGKFNEAARAAVLRYAHVWEEMVPRFGRWVDMKDSYRTMDASYTESVWWVFKTLYDKGLVYEGFKSMHLCPRCETTLSNFEVTQGYKDITDISVYVKFELLNEPGTYIVAWTTTPWTLPGNVALAVNVDLMYVKVSAEGGLYVVAKENVAKVFGDKPYSVIEEISGEKLVGQTYKPLFSYYTNTDVKGRENAWKIYHAPYVTLEKGTGIVHLAPAFGAEDLELAEKVGLPIIHHVGTNGKFKDEVKDFVGLDAKPKGGKDEKDGHQRTDVEIIKFLAGKGALFGKEKIIHSYPHCWRCETPLLNYAASSWFVRVTDFKDKLVAENKKIGWTPKEVGEGRFGKWLEGARDWAISRSRYWGAPIPVWKSEDGKELFVPGSLGDLKARLKPRNRFIFVRHGEAQNNILGVVSSDPNRPHHLTEKGKLQVEKTAAHLSRQKIDVIVASPFVRTQETANIIATKLGFKKTDIRTDARLRELGGGVLDGKPIEEYRALSGGGIERFTVAPENGETWNDIQKRMLEAVYDIDAEHEGKTILIVTHDTPGWLAVCGLEGLSSEETVALRSGKNLFFDNAEYKEVRVVRLPRNLDFKVDFHRPYIDEIVLYCKNGKAMKRVPDVFDCWFESGSMPYGEAQYRGEATETFDPKGGWFKKTKGFPADFIGEGLDQTRGWFYSMLVLGVALFGKSPYKHVIVNGLVLAEDGKKMAKRDKNYPDPMHMLNKYGADAVRYFMLTSPVVSAEDLWFSEKGVDDVVKKIINRLDNVVTFYETYADGKWNDKTVDPFASPNVLDSWILVRLNELVTEVTRGMEAYELHAATRPIGNFIDDLSTWYLRRSRDRFKSTNVGDRAYALVTIQHALTELAKVIAPFMPFFADDVYRRVQGKMGLESVHLEAWPQSGPYKIEDLEYMVETRKLVTLGLEARAASAMKVRQPLAKVTFKDSIIKGSQAHIELVKDEVNVKGVHFDAKLADEVILDTVLTPELKEEGTVREILRIVQDLRKDGGFSVSDKVYLSVMTDDDGFALIQRSRNELVRVAGVVSVIREKESADPEVSIDGRMFRFSVRGK